MPATLDYTATSFMGLPLAVLSLLSFVGYFLTVKLIPKVKDSCLRAGLSGKDINKNSDTLIPESLGIVPGVVYLTCVIMFQPFFPTDLGNYNAGLLSVCMMLLLGFADDVLDLRWRIKIALSSLATLPMLVAYSGSTDIMLPSFLAPIFGGNILHLGLLYYLFMLLVSVFCTNSINIYAGVNGLEVAQSVVIAFSVLLYNAVELFFGHDFHNAHSLSLFLLLPFATTSLGLGYWNWYPSRVFVGDTYTYFAGMALSVAGIMGHFSRTLMLFFLPQLLNFLLSLPQLFGFVACPKHRLPRLNPKTRLLEDSGNYTLINFALRVLGPTSEKNLVIYLTLFQIGCSLLAFVIRYAVAPILFYHE